MGQGHTGHWWLRPVRRGNKPLLTNKVVDPHGQNHEHPAADKHSLDGTHHAPRKHSLFLVDRRGLCLLVDLATVPGVVRLGLIIAGTSTAARVAGVAARGTLLLVHAFERDHGFHAHAAVLEDLGPRGRVCVALGHGEGTEGVLHGLLARFRKILEDLLRKRPLKNTVQVVGLCSHVLARADLLRARCTNWLSCDVKWIRARTVNRLANGVDLPWLQASWRRDDIENVGKRGRDVLPAGRPPGIPDGLLGLELADDVVWQDQLQEAQGVDELQDVGAEDEDPGDGDDGRVELHAEVKSHADGGAHSGERPTPLAVGQALLLPLPSTDEVKAEEQNLQHRNCPRGREGHPNGFELDVDVAKAIESKRLDVASEAQENGNTCIDVVLHPFLLAGRIESEVLRGHIPWQVVDSSTTDSACPVCLVLLTDP
mmetsp:Transcript_40715/g.73749  ORF Transcript_40715/g.73749 Transcript_40715/m.73749 type:complete len:427 (-) Transcript_40715:752-2032(-)